MFYESQEIILKNYFIFIKPFSIFCKSYKRQMPVDDFKFTYILVKMESFISFKLFFIE